MAERLVAALCGAVAVAVSALFAWVLADLLHQGLPELSLGFLLEAPRDAGRAGGIAPVIVATLLILLVCLAASLPIGLGTAVLLAEVSRGRNRFARAVRASLDVLAGVPSIVFGLFGNAMFSLWLGLGFSILSGGLTLACMVLPVLIRSCEQGLRAVPHDYRQAAAALGLSWGSTLRLVILPSAAQGLAVGLVLGLGRALAETAALLFTSGYVDRMPSSLLDSGRALSVHIYDLAMNVPGGEARACATAVVLVALLLLCNGLTMLLATRWQGSTAGR
ncbi:phosphate ABC transporter permease PstA [Cyanobium sp. LEGE 06113]|jgi:phosphate transport system permease protein|uniref:phosphate ABC transporter permease PstA n=1 Tax=Cyanobium sp. LEGE 06113 TaxID=1297573 RepID=UPI00187E1963|nr:phosphate ABC transporter permease PstA [Cyanobium sp. LEGE 06113]MBE9153329.1 phosphate ABC transporter permease PstA [Cyanobium sp. LEGE 06113]